MYSLLRRAFMTGTAERVLRHMDRPLKTDGTPRADNRDKVTGRLLDFGDGARPAGKPGETIPSLAAVSGIIPDP